MRSALLQSFFLLFVLSLVSAKSVPDDDCTQKLANMDKYMAQTLLIYNPKMEPFTSVAQARSDYCNPLLEDWLKEINKFKPCLKNFQKTVFGMVITNLRKTAKFTCSNEQEINNAVRHSRCFTQQNVVQLMKASNKVTIILEYAYGQNETSKMLGALCCGYHAAYNGLLYEINDICKEFGEGIGEFVRKLIRGMVSDAIDMMCGQYPDIETCDVKVPEIMNKVNSSLSQGEPIYSFTPFTTFVKIIGKLDEDLNV